ncbi:poly-gamma-glutamate hydrolase family protein [Streptomyces atratus]|uniref:poly-gamma-glutamate hydrolase family protein n=1 Tax=Streptomyces atratus TaxID=1893 RepID=UPI0021A378E5|nr:poly-gamma-glutamate hydrolase family protein [Streptomyces atratus]MCT2541326.1 poly-gamma-glutamate hydrolase family protein [Streptomyces atratus]
MADKYANWEELVSDRDTTTGELVNQEGRDWYIEVRPGSGTYLTHMAIHGGGIEAPPQQLADYAARPGAPFYTFAGIKSSNNTSLHITSTNFDEPQALVHAAGADRIVSWHGHADQTAGVAVTYVGGLDTQLGGLIRARLEAAGFLCEDPPGNLGGTDPDNICNTGLRSAGVQIELSRSQRQAFFVNGDLRISQITNPANRTDAFYAYVDAVRQGIADLPVVPPVDLGLTATVVNEPQPAVELTVAVPDPLAVQTWTIYRTVAGMDQVVASGAGATLPDGSVWMDPAPPACVPVTYWLEVHRTTGGTKRASAPPLTYTPAGGCGSGGVVGEQPNVLGCASTYSAVVHWRGGAQPFVSLDNLTACSWSRTINDISEASVTIAKGDVSADCCGQLGDVAPWVHELTVYRDGELVWQGPIQRVVMRRDAITLEAADVFSWFDHLVNTFQVRYISAAPDAQGRRRGPITYIAENHIRLNLQAFQLADVDYPGLLPYIVRRDTGLFPIKVEKDGSANTTVWTEYLGDILREWTKRGLTWTTVGRSLLLRGRHTTQARATARLTLDHFAGDIEVIKDGREGGTYGWATSQQSQDISDGRTLGTGRTRTAYGRLDVLVRIQEEDASAADLRAAALDAIAGRYPVPLVINVPDAAQLTSDAPVSIRQLVPGERIDLLADVLCTPIEQGFLLSDVEVSWGQGGEKVGIALIPLADVDEELG